MCVSHSDMPQLQTTSLNDMISLSVESIVPLYHYYHWKIDSLQTFTMINELEELFHFKTKKKSSFIATPSAVTGWSLEGVRSDIGVQNVQKNTIL